MRVIFCAENVRTIPAVAVSEDHLCELAPVTDNKTHLVFIFGCVNVSSYRWLFNKVSIRFFPVIIVLLRWQQKV